MGKTRVPQETADFNAYIVSTDNFLQDFEEGSTTVHNWERLGLSSTTAASWHSKRQTWDPLYLKFGSEAQRTKVVIKDVQDFKKDFTTFSVKPLAQIAASDNATAEDAVIFNVVLVGQEADPTHPTVPIAGMCIGGFEPLGGCAYKATFRTGDDTGRPSLAPGADSVQVALKQGGTPPAGVGQISSLFIFTKASFRMELGTENRGQNAYIAYRWYNTKYPDLGGIWSEVQTILIA